MFILPFWHTIGGHYTFELVPFDWFNNFFGFERNMFDRIGHFAVGFYALPIIEYLVNRGLVARKWIAVTYAIFAISFIAASYEWIEWWYAETEGGDAGAAFLGSQGDIWDAQKDMLMDVLGAVLVSVGYWFSVIFKRKNTE
jgi:putative membrane protein